jgi:hypothetical protein
MIYAFWCANEFLGLCHTFFRWGFISKHDAYWWSSYFGKHTYCIGHFVFMYRLLFFYLTQTVFPSSFLSLLASFNMKIMQVCGDIMGFKWWEFTQGPLARHHVQLPILFNCICIFIYGKLHPVYIFRELNFRWLRICALGFIFLIN